MTTTIKGTDAEGNRPLELSFTTGSDEPFRRYSISDALHNRIFGFDLSRHFLSLRPSSEITWMFGPWRLWRIVKGADVAVHQDRDPCLRVAGDLAIMISV